MKIAFSTSGKTLDAPLDQRFGRAAGFIVYDLDTNSFDVIDNQTNLNASQGAGIKSAETVVRAGAKAIVTGHCGPNAFRALSAAGISIYNSDAATVSEALEQYRAGTLKESGSPDVQGHWV